VSARRRHRGAFRAASTRGSSWPFRYSGSRQTRGLRRFGAGEPSLGKASTRRGHYVGEGSAAVSVVFEKWVVHEIRRDHVWRYNRR